MKSGFGREYGIMDRDDTPTEEPAGLHLTPGCRRVLMCRKCAVTPAAAMCEYCDVCNRRRKG